MLYWSEWWAINKADIQWIDAVDQWCLRRILVIRWHDSVSEMQTSVALQTSHHLHPSLSPVVSLSLRILHEWMRTQMLAKPSSNLLQRTGGDHRGGCAQFGWRTFMMTCLRWILGNMRLKIWRKIGLSADWCLCTVRCIRSGACDYWTGIRVRFSGTVIVDGWHSVHASWKQ